VAALAAPTEVAAALNYILHQCDFSPPVFGYGCKPFQKRLWAGHRHPTVDRTKRFLPAAGSAFPSENSAGIGQY
jgi:hypothetical protein